MKCIRLVVIVVIYVSVIACTEGVRRGVVAMKISESEAHVALGNDEVTPGDRVVLYRSSCQRRSAPSKGTRIECQKNRIGEGWITKTLTEHYSVLEVKTGTPFEEGDLVESPRR